MGAHRLAWMSIALNAILIACGLSLKPAPTHFHQPTQPQRAEPATAPTPALRSKPSPPAEPAPQTLSWTAIQNDELQIYVENLR